jgi:hypothetical protein
MNRITDIITDLLKTLINLMTNGQEKRNYYFCGVLGCYNDIWSAKPAERTANTETKTTTRFIKT